MCIDTTCIVDSGTCIRKECELFDDLFILEMFRLLEFRIFVLSLNIDKLLWF